MVVVLSRYAFEGVLQAIYGKDVLGNERGELDIDKEDCHPQMPCMPVTGDNVLERMDVSDAKVRINSPAPPNPFLLSKICY